jgi:hypothetical protein
MRCHDENRVGAAMVGGNGNGFVQKTMEVLDTNRTSNQVVDQK